MKDIERDLPGYLKSETEASAKLLCELIGFRSTLGRERDILTFLYDYLNGSGFQAEYASVEEDIVSDPDYTRVQGNNTYASRPNVVVNISGSGGGRSAIVNSHCDVVPAPDDMFFPSVRDGIVYGRGACDAKGQLVTIVLALRALKDMGVQLKGDLQAQIVIEEESGGNGSLSLIRQGRRADVAVVLEPTGLQMHPANRGAVWYKLAIRGKSAHMGKYWEARERNRGNGLFDRTPQRIRNPASPRVAGAATLSTHSEPDHCEHRSDERRRLGLPRWQRNASLKVESRFFPTRESPRFTTRCER